MESSFYKAGVTTVRTASEDDLDVVVEQTWAVAVDGRCIGTEAPFDRVARRQRLAYLVSGDSSTLLVADTSAAGGPGVVGHITVTVAPYGVADIGMLLDERWRGRGLGRADAEDLSALLWAAQRPSWGDQ